MRRPPKYVQGFIDRHGKSRFYLRRPGHKRVPLPCLPSPEFMAAYDAGMRGETTPARVEIGASRTAVGSVDHAIVSYYNSATFAALGPLTQKNRRAILERFRAEHGDKRLANLQRQHVAKIVHKLKPYAQRNLLKTLRGLIAFAMADSLIEDDPTLGVKPVKVGKSDGFYTWTEDDIATFEARHPVGSKARLAFAIMLYLGLRRSDVVRIGPQHIRNGLVSLKPQKTGRSTGFVLECPLHPELAAIIAATPCGHLSFVTTEHGKRFSAAGFGNWMRDRCDEAGLAQCTSHGLRKGWARRLAEAGASVHQIAAVTGHSDLREIEVYTRKADKKRMAGQAMNLMAAAFERPNHEHELSNPQTRFDDQRKIASVFNAAGKKWRPREKRQSSARSMAFNPKILQIAAYVTNAYFRQSQIGSVRKSVVPVNASSVPQRGRDIEAANGLATPMRQNGGPVP
jgi:integrase